MAHHLSDVDVAIFAEGTYPFVLGGVSSAIHQIVAANPQLTFGIVHVTWNGRRQLVWEYPRPANVRWIQTVLLDPREAFPERAAPDDPEGVIANFRAFLRARPGVLPVAERVLDRIYPRARIYHAHTTGYAGLAALAASAHHGGPMLLTEHALYARDAIIDCHGRGRDADASADALAAGFANELVPLPMIDDVLRHDWHEAVLRMARFIHERCSHAVYLSQRLRDEALRYGLKPEKATIIANGIDVQRFATTRRRQVARSVWRDACRAGEADWQLGFIGRVVPVKGVLDMIAAAARLRERGLRFRLHLIGPAVEDPAYAAACRERVAASGLDDVVLFRGVQDVAAALGDLDLVVQPSLAEAQPLSAMEAMAASVPLVATNVGSVREVVDAAGVLVPSRQPDLLAAAVLRLLGDADAYGACSAAGPSRIEDRFSARAMVDGYRHLYATYSTVTDFARLRGWSTSVPSSNAKQYAKSWSGITERIACAARSGDSGHGM